VLVEQVTVHTQREVRGTVTEGSLYADRLPLRTDQRKRYSRAYSGGVLLEARTSPPYLSISHGIPTRTARSVRSSSRSISSSNVDRTDREPSMCRGGPAARRGDRFETAEQARTVLRPHSTFSPWRFRTYPIQRLTRAECAGVRLVWEGRGGSL
jgi:hypothetical protein